MEELRRLIADFARARDWEKFHSPKNLLMALVGEVGELAAELQWQPDDVDAFDPARRDRLRSELADVGIYLVRLADVLDVDLTEAIKAKMQENEGRFPSREWRGRAE